MHINIFIYSFSIKFFKYILIHKIKLKKKKMSITKDLFEDENY